MVLQVARYFTKGVTKGHAAIVAWTGIRRACAMEPTSPIGAIWSGHSRQRGQSVTEFALVVPLLLLVLIAIADFGRFYASAVAVESAAREAADFGAFDSSNWTSINTATTATLMQQRACVAAAGSHLEGYATTDPVNNTTCTNPTFACALKSGPRRPIALHPAGSSGRPTARSPRRSRHARSMSR